MWLYLIHVLSFVEYITTVNMSIVHVHSRNIMEFYVSMGFLHEIHEKYISNCMRHGQNHLSTTSQPIVHNILTLVLGTVEF